MDYNDLNILYEDADITVCIKPVGIGSEDSPTEKGIIGFLSERARKPLHLLHRLDRNVGGVMVFANNKKVPLPFLKLLQKASLKRNILQCLTVYRKKNLLH